VPAEGLAGSTVIVIDVLRATSTICQALASGAREVVPFLEIEDALVVAAKTDRREIVLGGERGGKRIDGFDLGNSPAEYTPLTVGGRRVFITTTNGTRALHHARLAKRVILGSFLNLSAVVASVKDADRVDILCAGTDGAETSEDILAVGAIVYKLLADASARWRPDDNAIAAEHKWQTLEQAAKANSAPLHELVVTELRHSCGGENLIAVGNGSDLADCAQVDVLDVVPEFNIHDWRITAQ
jgi:2-phosphosulfolactate phosphatase